MIPVPASLGPAAAPRASGCRPAPLIPRPIILSCVVPRCRHIRDLPAVAARVQIDRSHAGDHRIEDILRRVMLRALMRK